jgi:N-acetylglucosaminyldiphosphoundecaprenol N-acetyl-beta-D-mannosaminyltransferase
MRQAAEGQRTAPRLEVLGCPLDVVTIDEAVERCERAIASRSYLQHMSVNAAKMVALRDNPAMRRVIASCGLITADGQSVIWAARMLGAKLPERVAGIDLMTRMLETASGRGYGVYVLGARREVLDAALTELRERCPRLRLVGSRDGYYADDEAGEVCKEIRTSGADILFVAMSSPRKEEFLAEHGPALGVPFAMGVGGSVDVIAGVTRRAPRLLQRAGLEWAYRLAQEPRRLARRYLTTNLRFAAMVLRALVTRRGSAVACPAPDEPSAAAVRREPTVPPR